VGLVAHDPRKSSTRSQAPPDTRQTKPVGTKRSGGQSSLTPSQLSGTSQAPAAGRHTPVCFPSGGQATLEPVQFSAGSQTPADGPHTAAAALKASAGQPLAPPSQLSATSQAPAAGRQTALLFAPGG